METTPTLKYKARIATTNVNANSMRLSEDALNDLVREQRVRVVTGGSMGETIGFTEKIELDEVGGFVTATINAKPINLDAGWFAVLAGLCDNKDIEDKGDHRLIKHMKLCALMLTLDPADPTLTPIEKGVLDEHKD